MKKVIITLLLGILFLTGCEENSEKNIDYSTYKFTNVTWVRDGEHDSETITFKSDGSFAYYCGCGNPVNDSDLCDSYTYNDKTKEIELECFETTEEMVKNIQIVEVTEERLKLNFNGEIKEFKKENN